MYGGLYGSGMHDFVLMECELGTRAAMAQSDEDCWTAEDMIYFAWMPLFVSEEESIEGDLTDGALDW